MAINFPTSLDSFSTAVDNTTDVMAQDINDVRDAIEALEAKVGIDSSAVTGSLDYKVNNFFTTNRTIWVYHDTAPTGWSTSGVSDGVLGIKGGTNAYNVSGGNTGGTWTQPDHTLITDELPSHNHGGTATAGGNHDHNVYIASGDGAVSSIKGWLASSGSWTDYVDNSGTHTHPIPSEGGGSAHSHGTIYRPYAAVGIMIVKT